MTQLNVSKRQWLLFVMMNMHCLSSYGMEIVENEYNKKLLEIVAHNVPHDDYDLHRTLSLVNVACKNAVENTYRPDKNRIEKYIATNLPQAKVTGYKSWNRDFTGCAWVNHDGNVADPKDLQLTLVGVVNNQVTTQFASWKYFYFPIFEDNRPFFDKDGQACFYGYGKTTTCDGSYRSFAQYCLDLNGNGLRNLCYFRYYENSNGIEQSLHILLQYPVLVKAFLRSKLIDVGHCCQKYDRKKTFCIKGVTIPDDYKMFKKSMELEQIEEMSFCICYSHFSSYDSLDADLRKVIDDHYEKQQQEKNSSTLQEK